MLEPVLQLGERVRLRHPVLWIASGRTGTVVQVYLSVPNLYDVLFDGYTIPRPVAGDDLERIELERAEINGAYG